MSFRNSLQDQRNVSPINLRVETGPNEKVTRVSRLSNTILETLAGESDNNGNRPSSIRRIVTNVAHLDNSISTIQGGHGNFQTFPSRSTIATQVSVNPLSTKIVLSNNLTVSDRSRLGQGSVSGSRDNSVVRVGSSRTIFANAAIVNNLAISQPSTQTFHFHPQNPESTKFALNSSTKNVFGFN